MGDQPVTRAELEGLSAAITALTNQVAGLATQMNNLVANNNDNQGGDRREQNWRPRAIINQAGSSSSSEEEESVDEEEDHQNRQDYRVKVDIPLFYGTMGVDEFLDWQIDVDRFFDVMEVLESKQVKMVAIRLKSTAAVW